MPSAKSQTPTVVITGANGFLGSVLVAYFSKKGWNVRGLVRNPSVFKSSDNVTYLEYDLAKNVDLSQIFDGATHLVHTAYAKYTTRNTDARDINTRGSKRLVDAGKKHGLIEMVFISTMSAHEGATSVYGQQKLTIEEYFLKAGGVVLRCGLIIGRGGILEEMSRFMRSWHTVPLIAGGKQPLQIVAISDLARVIDVVLSKQQSGRYVIATPSVYSYKSFYKALANALHVRIVFIHIPYNLLLGLFKIAAVLHLPLGLGEDNLRGLQQLRSMKSEADLSKLGVQLMDLDAALKETA